MPTIAQKPGPVSSLAIAPTRPQTLLAFNEEGEIDCFLFDDTLEKSPGFFSLSNIAKANMVLSVSQQLQFTPGDTATKDQQIKNALRTNLSPTLTNPDQVIAELFCTWQNMVAPGNMKLIMEKYFCDLIEFLSQRNKTSFWHLLQVFELYHSTQTGRPFSTNPFEKVKTLKIWLVAHSTPHLNKRLKDFLSEEWFTMVVNYLGIELKDILSEERDRVQNYALAQALTNLLAGKHTYPTTDTKIKNELEVITTRLKTPQADGFFAMISKKAGKVIPFYEIREAIKYTISREIISHQFILTPPAPPPQLTPYYKRGLTTLGTLLAELPSVVKKRTLRCCPCAVM